MRQPCQHDIRLEKGLRCDHGYIQVFLRHNGTTICKNFGVHTREAQEAASIYLADRRRDILNSLIGVMPKTSSKTFKEVAEIWYVLWQEEKKPDGSDAHSKGACYKVKWTLDRVLVPEFGKKKFEEITANDVSNWRSKFNGTTANRYQAILSSIYSHCEKWVKTEKIKPGFTLPKENPCKVVEMAPSNKRTRILSKYEASKLKLAFVQLNDLDGWEICKLALKSMLSLSDLQNLEIGQEIDINRSKTGVGVNIPIVVTSKLNWFGWRTRWRKARQMSGLTDVQFRDLRKTPMNWLKGRHDIKLISEYAGHADIATTQKAYMIRQSEYLEPLARDIEKQVDDI